MTYATKPFELDTGPHYYIHLYLVMISLHIEASLILCIWPSQCM